MLRAAPDIHARLRAAVERQLVVKGERLVTAGDGALQTLIGDGGPHGVMLKDLKALIRSAKDVGTCTATWWYLAVDVLGANLPVFESHAPVPRGEAWSCAGGHNRDSR